MKKYAIINEAQFPIVRVTFTGESADSENFPFYLSEVKQTYDYKKNGSPKNVMLSFQGYNCK